MTRQEWKKSTSKFRSLIRDFRGSTVEGLTKYKFGVVKYRNTYYIWNGVRRNSICSVKFNNDNVLVRYRKNSFYKNEIMKIHFSGRKTIFVESNNLGRYRNLLEDNIQHRINLEDRPRDRVEFSYNLPHEFVDRYVRGTTSAVSSQG